MVAWCLGSLGNWLLRIRVFQQTNHSLERTNVLGSKAKLVLIRIVGNRLFGAVLPGNRASLDPLPVARLAKFLVRWRLALHSVTKL